MENREYYESIKTERAARAVIAAIAPPGDFWGVTISVDSRYQEVE